MIAFFSGEDVYSNFYKTPIDKYGIRFSNSEQLFMYEKAMLFGDVSSMNVIAITRNPKEVKKLGRLVKGFDQDLWDNKKYDIMSSVVYEKFTQNRRLREYLLNSKYDGYTYVEASPYDKIWGVGISQDNPDVFNKDKWLGENLLGKVLGEVRERIKSETVV